MSRYLIVLVLLLCRVALGTPEGDQRRVDKACSTLDDNYVSKIQERVVRGIAHGSGKGKIIRNVREWLKELGVDGYDGCLVAIARAETNKAEQHKAVADAAKLESALAELADQEKEWITSVGQYTRKEKERITSEIAKIGKVRRRTPKQSRADYEAAKATGSTSHYPQERKRRRAALQQQLAGIEAEGYVVPRFIDDYGVTIEGMSVQWVNTMGAVGTFGVVETVRIVSDGEIIVDIELGTYGRDTSKQTLVALLGLTGPPAITGEHFQPQGIYQIAGSKTYDMTNRYGAHLAVTIHTAELMNVDPKKLAQFIE